MGGAAGWARAPTPPSCGQAAPGEPQVPAGNMAKRAFTWSWDLPSKPPSAVAANSIFPQHSQELRLCMALHNP